MIGLILQARMNSARLPGKVMELVNGEPLIWHVIRQCRLAHKNGPVIVCTSDEKTDDAIFDFCKSNDVDIFRGSLDDVYSRYLGCIERFKLRAFGRICCDSPGISADLVRFALKTFEEKKVVDLVSNVCVRTFPVGQSIEIVNAQTFSSPQFKQGRGFSAEHVTQAFYKNSNKYGIFNIQNHLDKEPVSWAVDEPGDIEKVSALLKIGFHFDEESISIDRWVQ